MTLYDAVIGLKAYKEVDERMEQLWRNIDGAIISPRMDKNAASLPKIRASGDILELDGRAESTIQALMTDLKSTFTLLAEKLPHDLMDSLCKFMMVDLIPRLVQKWLTPAIPTSLDNIPDFDQMIDEAGELCTLLRSKGYTHYDELQQWVDDAPNIWLRRCTEKALDTVRVRLGKGIGQSRQVEKVEKHMVSLAEGKELATTGAGATADTNDWGDDWGDAWDDDDGDNDQGQKEEANKLKPHQEQQDSANADEDDGADAWGWGDEEPEKPAEEPKQMEKQSQKVESAEEDDSAAAWGWGDDGEGEESQALSNPKGPSREAKKNPLSGATRELVMKETYHISSMPEPVLELIFSLLEDGATLVKDAHRFGHVAATANGLFALPTYVLSLFRAISPHYYAIDGGGNM
jgi:protein transport protein DSL1/ZW10